jgi:hypothetical protein
MARRPSPPVMANVKPLIMFSLFKKKSSPIPLEQQLEALADCGVTLNADVITDDLFMFHSRDELEATPYTELIPTLGYEIEREPFSPISNRLWMCDYERIEDHGSYADVVSRLHKMSEESLPISNTTDYVEIEEEIAWVEFDLAGTKIHWDAKVDNDWLDPRIVVKFDNLLQTHESPFRIYSNHTDFGQSAFFACFTRAEFERFQKLVTFKLSEIEKHA